MQAMLENYDARAEGARRFVDVNSERVAIARRLAGVDMRVAVPTASYRGVALSVLVSEGFDFLYQVRLVHADADLDVTLAASGDEAAARGEWRRWARALSLARLVERAEGAYEIDRSPAPTSWARRRGRATLRIRFLARRKPGVTRAREG